MFKLVVLSALLAITWAKPSEVAPVVAQTFIAPAAVSHTFREDIIKTPAIVAKQVAPAVAKTVVAEPLVAKTIIAPGGVSKTYREDIIIKPEVVAEPIAQKVALEPVKAKLIEVPAPVVATPIQAKTIIAPPAVSYTFREDVIKKPAGIVYTAPTIAYDAPLVYVQPW